MEWKKSTVQKGAVFEWSEDDENHASKSGFSEIEELEYFDEIKIAEVPDTKTLILNSLHLSEDQKKLFINQNTRELSADTCSCSDDYLSPRRS